MLQTSSFVLQGGLNLVTPAIRTPAGHAIAALNYESVERGYARVDGFERYDGHPKPSDATYHYVIFDQGSVQITEGMTVTGGSSGATGVVLSDAILALGSYGGGDAEGYFAVSGVVGQFIDNEPLKVSGVTYALANGDSVERGATTTELDQSYYQDAIETTRALIQKVPGTGPVRGVWVYNGAVYAFRDNVAQTKGVMHKASPMGWTEQALGLEIAFTSGGTYEIQAGDVITGATSAAFATVTRVIVSSGDWTTGDAAGYLVLSVQTGTLQAENLDVGANLNVATIAGNSAEIALPIGGQYEFRNHNFYGASDRYRMYGVNGVGNAFEWDGSVFVKIRTGMVADTPNHIAIFKMHLFLSFIGGSVQHSGTGEPLVFAPIFGASEIAIGQEVTGFSEDYGQTMLIFGRNTVAVLYGNSVDDWSLEVLTKDAGGIEWTIQRVGYPIYHDDRGLRDVRTTAAFGDFKMGTMSQMVDPLLVSKKKAGITPINSLRVRSKDQYRLFWSDGSGMSFYMGRKVPEAMPFDLGMPVTCCCSSEDNDGDEILFFGSEEGYVYQLDSGTSFDGQEVNAFCRLAFNHCGLPMQNKRFGKASIEADCSADTELGVFAQYDYADPDQPFDVFQSLSVSGSGGFWDEANWDEFYWSAPVEGVAEAYIDGFGQNCSITIVSTQTYAEPHTIHGLTLYFSYRGLKR